MSTTVDTQNISLKIHNYNYAPGIATYGIDGKTGPEGESGNNIYYTNFLINSGKASDIKGIAKLIAALYLPIKNSTTAISRPYTNGDYFFDYNGTIFKLINLELILSAAQESSGDPDGYASYFSIVAKINVDDNQYVTYTDDRLILNSSYYTGFDIVSSQNLTDRINTNATLNIVSDSIDENNRIQLLLLNGIDSNSLEDGTALVYYDTTENAFHLDSNIPLVIDADVKIDPNEISAEYDNYSTIMTSHDSITYFKSLCDKLTYNITTDEAGNNYMIIYAKDYEDLDDNGASILQELVDKGVYAKTYGLNGLQALKLLDHYETNNGNFIEIPNASLADYTGGADKIATNFKTTQDGFDITVEYQYNNAEMFNGTIINTSEQSLSTGTFKYMGKNNISYVAETTAGSGKTSRKMKKNISAYIYRTSTSGLYVAVFDPRKLVPYVSDNDNRDIDSTTLNYYTDFVAFRSDKWDAQKVTLEKDIDKLQSAKVIYPAITTNENVHLSISTLSWSKRLDQYMNSAKKSTIYIANSVSYDINVCNYYTSGSYEFKFKYVSPPEIDDINNCQSYNDYDKFSKHSTDALSMNVKFSGYSSSESNYLTIWTYIVPNYYYLSYLMAQSVYATSGTNLYHFNPIWSAYWHYAEEAGYPIDKDKRDYTYEEAKLRSDIIRDHYVLFIDGEEYTFKFDLEINDKGLKLSNCKFSGKLYNNVENTTVPAFKMQIPDFVGETGKVSLMHNTEIFLS